MEFLRKQSMQLASKMRFMSAQIVALLSDELWRRNAENANAMAARLASGVQDAPGVRITDPVEANAVFALVDRRATERLKQEFPFEVWREDTGQVRWMTSWATREADVDAFAARIREVTAEYA
jgi:threonine aldolase